MKEENIGKIGNFNPEEYIQPAQTIAKLCLIFGIISMATFIFDGIGVFPGIAGLVCGLIAEQRGNDSKIRFAGMVVSTIGAILSVLALLEVVYFAACYTADADTIASLILR